MYSDNDLDVAVEKGVFTATDVQAFKALMTKPNHSSFVDDENIKLVGGFNDIFIVIACCLLLFSAKFALTFIDTSLADIAFVIISWGLAEFFVLKRKMALPAIVLLLTFVGGIIAFVLPFFPEGSKTGLAIAASLATVATYLHWLRFKVPITVAAGTVALICVIIAGILSSFPSAESIILPVILICGLASWSFAMYWDAKDTLRITNKTDIAFWLHLISAPLIIHPIFSSIGLFSGNETLIVMVFVIILYCLMTFISIVIDRRAFMVSSLIYVIYAFSTIFESIGMVGYSFAVTGMVIGAGLLLLSALWQKIRAYLVALLPSHIQQYVPAVVSLS